MSEAWIIDAVGRGAGEILLTSMDRDGTREGFDTELTRAARGQVQGLNERVLARTPAGRWGAPADFEGIAVRAGVCTGLNTPSTSPSGNIHGMPLACCIGLGPKELTGIGGAAPQVEATSVALIGLRSVDDVNNRQKRRLYEKLHAHFDGDLAGRTFAVWGLAFKPRTDDMREAPSIGLVRDLLAAGCKVNVHDPEAMDVAKGVFGNSVNYCAKNYDALNGADALCIVTEWNEFRHPDFERIRSSLKSPVIFDGRNLWEPRDMQGRGFTYYAIGRNAASLA